MATASSATSVHDFTVKDASGEEVDLSVYKGKVLLIVNVASQCGLTNSNYTELSQLYEKYKDQVNIREFFDCNNKIWVLGMILALRSWPSHAISLVGRNLAPMRRLFNLPALASRLSTPIFDKVDVNGNNVAPIYKFLKSSKGGLFGDSIKWNFSKFLVDKEGRVVDRYAPTTSPLSIEKNIKKLVASP